ncbi:hypothetical protein EON65_50090 [archaeon]|nr:MAG: hypothetical protein EON65_50090 [archaeon]
MRGLLKIGIISQKLGRSRAGMLSPHHIVLRSYSLGARKKKGNDEDITKMINDLPEGWSKVSLKENEEVEDAIMDRRIDEAKNWVSMSLSDEDVAFLNKKLGIDEEALLAMQDEEKSTPKKSSKKRLSHPSLSTNPYSSHLNEPTKIQTRNLRGYLQINPFICSGCGSAFQTKTEDSPGYLPTDKFAEHRSRAQLIKEKQEAIKILEIAEVSLDSPAAEEYLRLANVSPKIIEGIKKIGEQLRSLTATPYRTLTPTNNPSSDLPNSSPGKSGEGLEEKICVCQRCFRLQQYGQVREVLRPGWSNLPLLSPEHFTSLLQNIKVSSIVYYMLVSLA